MVAQWKARQAAKRPRTAKLVTNDRLRGYVQERLAGNARRPDGTIVVGPEPPAWKGLNKPHRQDRRWATAWFSHRLKVDFPGDESTRISHEAVYSVGHGLEHRTDHTGMSPPTSCSPSPPETAGRAVPGHWEGDLIIGTGR